MKIIATVNFGETPVAQHWEFLTRPSPALVLLRAENEGQENVPFVLKLDNDKIHSSKHRSGHAITERHYDGPLNASDAFFLKTTENTR